MPDAPANVRAAWHPKYEQGVIAEYQRTAKLRNTVTVKPLDGASEVDFLFIGTSKANKKSDDPAALVKTSKAPTRNVIIKPEEWEWGDWVGDIDMKKTGRDYMQQYEVAGATALHNTIDDIILGKFATGATDLTGTGDLAAAAALTKQKCQKIRASLAKAYVPLTECTVLVDPDGFNDLLNIPEFSDRDFVGDKEQLPWVGAQMKRWLGMMWLEYEDLPRSGNVVTCYAYAKSAVGLIDIQKENMSLDMDWGGGSGRRSWFMSGEISTNAGILHPAGVKKIDYTPAVIG